MDRMKQLLIAIILSSCVLLFPVTSLTGQSFEWVYEPEIEGYDTVEIHKNNLDFLVTKDNGKYGIISLDKGLLLPAEFEKVISVRKEYVYLKHKDGYFYYDHSGKKLDFIKDIIPIGRKNSIEYRNEKTKVFLDRLQNIWPGVDVIYPENKNDNWSLIIPSHDTIISFANIRNTKIINDRFFYYSKKIEGNRGSKKPKRENNLIDKDLNRIVDSEFQFKEVLDNGCVIFSDFVLDQNGRLYLEGFDRVQFGPLSRKYFAQKDGKTYIFNEDFSPFINKAFDRVESELIDDDIYMTLYQVDTTTFLHLKSMTLDVHPYVLEKIKTRIKRYRTFVSDSLIGLYDIKDQKVVLEPQFKYIKYKAKNLFVGADRPLYHIPHENMMRTLFNVKGEILFQSVNRGINPIVNKMIDKESPSYYQVFYSDDVIVLYDKNFKELRRVHSDDKIHFSREWAIEYKNGVRKIYPAEAYLNGDLSVYYDEDPKTIGSTVDYIRFQSVKKNGKIGFLSEYGDVLFPCVLDDITSMNNRGPNYKGYFMAKMDGKWGVMRRPPISEN